jgi:hypothetical protein
MNQGCITAASDPTKTLYQPTTSFDLNLSYPILEVGALTVGYQNISRQIGENGQRRGMFYSPDAQFYVDLTANLDGIYSKATGHKPSKPTPRETASR